MKYREPFLPSCMLRCDVIQGKPLSTWPWKLCWHHLLTTWKEIHICSLSRTIQLAMIPYHKTEAALLQRVHHRQSSSCWYCYNILRRHTTHKLALVCNVRMATWLLKCRSLTRRADHEKAQETSEKAALNNTNQCQLALCDAVYDINIINSIYSV